jgi:hypothetical protein
MQARSVAKVAVVMVGLRCNAAKKLMILLTED